MDTLGDKLKELEMQEAGRKMMPGLPVIARLDGRAFHTFTRGMKRPYDTEMMECMAYTTKKLVKEFHALVGYTQSDEITLIFNGPHLFDGRYQKLTSVLAGYCSAAFFMKAMWTLSPIDPPRGGDEDGFPKTECFDCRVFQVPDKQTAIDVLAWREYDAVKNSVAMAAQSVYSHKQLHGMGRADQMDMLHAKGINWNDYPVHFKRGIYIKRFLVVRPLTEEERMAIPEKHRPGPDTLVTRSEYRDAEFPPIRQLPNAIEEIFGVDNQP